MRYLLLALLLPLVGCSINRGCCYGDIIPEGYTCADTNSYVDCTDEYCQHYRNCTNLKKE